MARKRCVTTVRLVQERERWTAMETGCNMLDGATVQLGPRKSGLKERKIWLFRGAARDWLSDRGNRPTYPTLNRTHLRHLKSTAKVKLRSQYSEVLLMNNTAALLCLFASPRPCSPSKFEVPGIGERIQVVKPKCSGRAAVQVRLLTRNT